jgi:hypothetical protein
MKRKRYLSVLAVLTGLVLIQSCDKSFLDITPNGSLDAAVMATYAGVDGLLIGAYSMVDGITPQGWGEEWAGATSGWVYGSIRGMEANKGTDAGDQSYINSIQSYTETTENFYINVKWKSCYEGVSRCNQTIATAMIAEEAGEITSDEATLFIRQARALRGFFHLEAWRLWADMGTNTFVPYLDETVDPFTVTNTEDVRGKIIEDLLAGVALPNDMGQVGRFNKTVCQVLAAKAYMQMYRDYDSAKPLLSSVVSSGTNPAGQACGFMPNYGDVFDAEFRNGVESIYTVQYSVNDGSGGWNAGWGEVLNFPNSAGPGACCGFFQPTQDFVNSFRTDGSGLPFLDNSYNSEKVINDQGILSADPFTEYTGNLDPRLDWSVGRRGISYWDWGEHPGYSWIRDQTNAGPYSPKKQVFKASQEGILTEVGNWTSGWTANGYRLIRYADAVLLLAECKAMTNEAGFGLDEVNDVRDRVASNPASWVKNADATNAATYVIGLYGSFASQADAMTAIKFERKLELGQEGHRYYDLQRWGDVQTELSRVMSYESTMEWAQAYGNSPSVGAEDKNFPIPQRQIDLASGNLIQNR